MSELMTPTALHIEKEALVWDALKIMQKDPKKWVTVLPVIHQGKIAGILHMHSIIQAGIA
jgi:signal-transduction protein with cAMP-binding, CBS, and nucleotidyltransferase domain